MYTLKAKLHRRVFMYIHEGKIRNSLRLGDKSCRVVVTGVLVAQRLGRWTLYQAVAGSIPGRGATKSPRSTQPSIPPG